MSELAFDTGPPFGGSGSAPPLAAARRYDALVLGAGPAGITAAIYLVRKGFATGVIAPVLGGQVAWTAEIENYLGYRLIDGATLVARFREQVAEHSPDLGIGLEASAIERRGDRFAVRAGAAEYAARAVIVATGKRPRLLGVPGEQRLLGRGVASCAICDAPLYRGRTVAVVGGGNSGLEAALDLAKLCPRVHLFQDLDHLTGDEVFARRVRAVPQIEIHLGLRVAEIVGEERVRAVRARPAAGGEAIEVPVEGVFVEIGLVPNSELVRGVAALNARGEIEVDGAGRTAVPGLFAAGDVTTVPYKQIVIAAGEGAKAALSAHDYLLRLEAGGR
ncbi:MAG TPA: FAD-dependent oxidoreductase [Candidatus Methanoperedens sp.]|nr:FAD-dependent oxidoreductase [Candidatus Methanoperedens sp.]